MCVHICVCVSACVCVCVCAYNYIHMQEQCIWEVGYIRVKSLSIVMGNRLYRAKRN